MLQDPKTHVNPNETSMMSHPDTSMKIYEISMRYVYQPKDSVHIIVYVTII